MDGDQSTGTLERRLDRVVRWNGHSIRRIRGHGALELWPIDYDEEWVATPYGRTHIISSGPEDGTPVFLIPGLFADATMWYATVGPLASAHRVHAVDLPVFAGKSESSDRPVESIEDYSAWFQSLLESYGYERSALAGLSYGSWISLALAREIPETIDAVVHVLSESHEVRPVL